MIVQYTSIKKINKPTSSSSQRFQPHLPGCRPANMQSGSQCNPRMDQRGEINDYQILSAFFLLWKGPFLWQSSENTNSEAKTSLHGIWLKDIAPVKPYRWNSNNHSACNVSTAKAPALQTMKCASESETRFFWFDLIRFAEAAFRMSPLRFFKPLVGETCSCTSIAAAPNLTWAREANATICNGQEFLETTICLHIFLELGKSHAVLHAGKLDWNVKTIEIVLDVTHSVTQLPQSLFSWGPWGLPAVQEMCVSRPRWCTAFPRENA